MVTVLRLQRTRVGESWSHKKLAWRHRASAAAAVVAAVDAAAVAAAAVAAVAAAPTRYYS